VKLGRSVIRLVFCGLLSVSFSVDAQPSKKVPHISYLSSASASVAALGVDTSREGLRQLGYVEGQNILVEWKHADGKLDRLGELAGISAFES
jgi:hypothetical protein